MKTGRQYMPTGLAEISPLKRLISGQMRPQHPQRLLMEGELLG